MIFTSIVYIQEYRLILENAGEMIFVGSEGVNMYIQILNPPPPLQKKVQIQYIQFPSPKKEFWIWSYNNLHQKYMTFAIIWPPINYSKTSLDRQTD